MTKSSSLGTLMIIDDDEVDQMMYRRIIQRSGVANSILQFSLAADALEYLRQPDREEIDLIVLDINMPIMNGFEFLEAATKEFGVCFTKAIVVMMTTSINSEDVARARSFGVVKDFLNKPLTIEAIKNWPDTVHKHVSQR